MILTEKPPQYLNVCGKEYAIYTDFREVLRYSEEIRSDSTVLEIVKAVDRMYKHNDEIITPERFGNALDQLNWFISCGEENRKKKPSNSALGMNRNKPFDFKHDGSLIYSAFQKSYGIDLYETEYMHWWIFNSLLNDIDKDCRISKVMEYRTIDLKSKNLSKEQKKLYSALQNYYKIQEERSKAEDDFINALLEGMDPMKV